MSNEDLCCLACGTRETPAGRLMVSSDKKHAALLEEQGMLPVWSGQRDAMQGRQRQSDGGGQTGQMQLHWDPG